MSLRILGLIIAKIEKLESGIGTANAIAVRLLEMCEYKSKSRIYFEGQVFVENGDEIRFC